MSISQEVLDRYRANRMTAFAKGVSTLVTLADYESLSLEGVLVYAIDFVEQYKANEKAEKIREGANIPYPCAALSDIDFSEQPQIAQSEVEALVAKTWARVGDHQVVTGIRGNEKLKFASAIANEFVDKATSTFAMSLNKLLIDLRVSFGTKQFDTKTKELNKVDVLLIYDWLLKDKPIEDVSLLSLFLKARKKPLLIVINMTADHWRKDIQQSKLPEIIKKSLVDRTHYWPFKEPPESIIH